MTQQSPVTKKFELDMNPIRERIRRRLEWKEQRSWQNIEVPQSEQRTRQNIEVPQSDI
ncbi:hypothetical protein [Paenibacillus sp. Soil787]|uniref:hypothetical protein n=1 Tax=Paenibacillus sp. Soil787 TaxID=1736411 RepID=UPI0012E36DDA|nr:hypothetical protein [Paenibacillus sp. Soil787]